MTAPAWYNTVYMAWESACFTVEACPVSSVLSTTQAIATTVAAASSSVPSILPSDNSWGDRDVECRVSTSASSREIKTIKDLTHVSLE